MSNDKEKFTKVRVKYGPWKRGLNLADDPSEMDDQSLADITNFDIARSGVLVPRPAIRCIKRPTVVDPTYASIRVLGYDNTTVGGTFTVAVIAQHLYAGTTANNTIFYLVKSSETQTLLYPNNLITASMVTTLGGGDIDFYKYIYYDGKGYFLSTDPTSCFYATDLNVNVKVATPLVPANGTDAFIFKDRMWIIAGKRIYYSKATDPTIWAAPDGGFFDLVADDHNDPILCYAIVNDTLYFFKRNSTYQFNYSSDPGADGYLRTISRIQGAVNAVVYNGLVFTLSTRCLYQFVNGQYISISETVNRNDTNTKFYRLALYDDKLFAFLNPVGSAMQFYVLDLNTGSWSLYYHASTFQNQHFQWSWEVLRPFVEVDGGSVLVFSDGNGLYTHSVTSTNKYDALIDRASQVRTLQRPDYFIGTKTFNFEDDYAYKRMYGVRLAGEPRIDGNSALNATLFYNWQDSENLPNDEYDANKKVIITPNFRFIIVNIGIYWDSDTPTVESYWSRNYNTGPGSFYKTPYIRSIEMTVQSEAMGTHD